MMAEKTLADRLGPPPTNTAPPERYKTNNITPIPWVIDYLSNRLGNVTVEGLETKKAR